MQQMSATCIKTSRKLIVMWTRQQSVAQNVIAVYRPTGTASREALEIKCRQLASLQISVACMRRVGSRTVCFHWSGKCCNWNTVIQVRNCGAYFVYKLVKPTACHLRYCGIDWCVLHDGLAVVFNRLEGNISLLWFISPANQHPISTIKKKSPHTFAHLGNFSQNESARFDNHKILLFGL